MNSRSIGSITFDSMSWVLEPGQVMSIWICSSVKSGMSWRLSWVMPSSPNRIISAISRLPATLWRAKKTSMRLAAMPAWPDYSTTTARAFSPASRSCVITTCSPSASAFSGALPSSINSPS